MSFGPKIQELRSRYDELRQTLDLDALLAERESLNQKMAEPGFWDDNDAAQEVVQRLKSVKQETDAFTQLATRLDDLEVMNELATSEEDADAEKEVERDLETAEGELDKLQLRTYFTGDHDRLSAFINLQAGAGGVDACDWTEMMMRLLSRYSEQQGFDVEVIDVDYADAAGISSATLHVKGAGAFGWLKSERGTHRLVRISPFDAQKRRQTSFTAVDVTPEFDDAIEVEINDSELRVDTYSAGGPGGQHVNKTQSAVRITHLPTGIVVQCQNERHQHANKRTAMQMLKNRLYQLELEKREKEAAAGYSSKSNMGFGAADRIRSYTLQPFTLVKDSRTGHEETNVQRVLDGGIEGFVEAYLRWAATQER
ncbi:MAG: peptide chain release factor 2 [Planctomycetota bacterium]